MTQFKTLLQREWMQHHRGWLLMMLVPPVLMLLAVLFGQIEGLHEGDGAEFASSPLVLMMISTGAVTALVLFITWAAVGLQAPGQARRDQQDRSIEFWLSMPVSNSASIGATVLMQFFLVPLLAVALGWACSQIIGLVVVARFVGPGAWFSLPWGALLNADLALLLRLTLGVVLAMLWFMPLLLLSMVASAWLKRWGVPVMIAAIGAGGLVLDKLYGITWVFDVIKALTSYGSQALLHVGRGGGDDVQIKSPDDILPVLDQLPSFLAHDGLAALRDCAQPLFLGALLFSAGCFALLVLRRRRGA
ncbi:MAG: hypothetical protein IV092_01215 [Burkholderiaceae bacterium]|nr:hypothetical protein [Burkholderiaceae bacterium]MBT9499834.1 hypothetical protein [Burkholderiaceae bacterium]